MPFDEYQIRTEIFCPFALEGYGYTRIHIVSLVFEKPNEDLLLIDPYAFQDATTLAGLTESHIEFLGLYAPKPIKKFLWEGMNTKETLQSAYQLAASLPGNPEQHKKRFLSVFQYISDNAPAFQF